MWRSHCAIYVPTNQISSLCERRVKQKYFSKNHNRIGELYKPNVNAIYTMSFMYILHYVFLRIIVLFVTLIFFFY